MGRRNRSAKKSHTSRLSKSRSLSRTDAVVTHVMPEMNCKPFPRRAYRTIRTESSEIPTRPTNTRRSDLQKGGYELERHLIEPVPDVGASADVQRRRFGRDVRRRRVKRGWSYRGHECGGRRNGRGGRR